MDKLEEIFKMQAELNDKTFIKCGIANHEGRPLSMKEISSGMDWSIVTQSPLGPNTYTNEWLTKYLWALKAEAQELEDELLPKWWSRDTLDLQNIRVEIVDMMHFLTSLAITAGLSAEEFHRLYTSKHKVNEQRQENGYCKENKTEDDNKTIV